MGGGRRQICKNQRIFRIEVIYDLPQGKIAPMVSGTITIKHDGDKYDIVFDTVDDMGFTIKGEYHGTLPEFTDRSDEVHFGPGSIEPSVP